MSEGVRIAVATFATAPGGLEHRLAELPPRWRDAAPPGAARAAYIASRWLLWRTAPEGVTAASSPLSRHSGPPWWSLSHTTGLAACIWSPQGRCGVDIERSDRAARHREVARRYFATTEADWLLSLPEDAQRDAFLGLWTRKEAVIKALGAGIAHHLPQIVFAPSQDAPVSLPANPPPGELHVQQTVLDGGVLAAAWFGGSGRAEVIRLVL